jgi:hypothetical protein
MEPGKGKRGTQRTQRGQASPAGQSHSCPSLHKRAKVKFSNAITGNRTRVTCVTIYYYSVLNRYTMTTAPRPGASAKLLRNCRGSVGARDGMRAALYIVCNFISSQY